MKFRAQRTMEKKELKVIKKFISEMEKLNPERKFRVKDLYIFVDTDDLSGLNFPKMFKVTSDVSAIQQYGFIRGKTETGEFTIMSS